MPAPAESLAYLVLDIETAVDGRLVAGIQFPGEDLTAEEATARYAQQRLEATGSDFIPHTYQVPVGIVVAKVAADFRLVDLVVLDEPQYRSHVMTRDLWRGWEAYRRPTLVTFNGRTFDLPVLEMAAFRYGVSVPAWFAADGPSYEKPRYRYNQRSHLDLMDLLTNFGASRFPGGLDLAARLLGKPGKIDVCGQMVQELFDQGRLGEISDYCRCDVLDTYFVFLRSRVLVGELDISTEQKIVAETRTWLETQSASSPGLAKYLENWGDWTDPWTVVPVAD